MDTATYTFTGAEDWGVEEGPRIPIRVWSKSRKKSIVVFALADTGASGCVFPAEMATYLDHNLDAPNVNIHNARTFNGRPVKTYRHTFFVDILTPDRRDVIGRNKMIVPCVSGLAEPLLGVHDCLTSFKVTVDYPKKRIKLGWTPQQGGFGSSQSPGTI
ncbi:MAG: hypothetical protein A2498_15070 [Lentisphaerae bacterium RIFOXYC12_FULL_60_16]|nr:MAG: hypothetical protein A2498_15070 [Lentisphaerae bacterium RIFOXYC12_FULL_60_16]